jgi:hypothetical protein
MIFVSTKADATNATSEKWAVGGRWWAGLRSQIARRKSQIPHRILLRDSVVLWQNWILAIEFWVAKLIEQL